MHGGVDLKFKHSDNDSIEQLSYSFNKFGGIPTGPRKSSGRAWVLPPYSHSLKARIYPYLDYYSTAAITEWGQHPRSGDLHEKSEPQVSMLRCI